MTINSSVYFFGELSSGYIQYPEDSSSYILGKIISNCKAQTQLVIRRDENLIYYCYIRKLLNNKYVGVSIVINGFYTKNVTKLFPLFENTIEKLATQGSIICFSNEGNIIPCDKTLKEQEEDIDSISSNLSKEFTSIGIMDKLPIVNYAIAKDSIKTLSVTDDENEIARSTYTYGYTYIYKDVDYNTVRVDSYSSILGRVNNENSELKKKNIELKQENQKVRRQKKQFRNVIFLFLILILCCIGLYFLYENLANTQGQLYDANGTIHRQTQVIQKKKEKISYLNNTITSLQGQLENEKNERFSIESKLDKVCSSYPFIVTNCTVSSTEISFDYYTTVEKEITVTLKAVNDRNSEVVTNTHTDTYYKGGGHKSFSFSYSLNSSYYYYVVLIYDGQIIAGKRW